ncbi:hypothetical protein [Denitromonas sp.]|uniref:hypothetical protein n=1 Tax=Denitromonas sp. TaxID=2734609 RepID=UPI002B000A21|nr:hypothetical protein [Denitromonas sp.]
MHNRRSAELSFISRYRVTDTTLEYAAWRTNEFESDVWECLFGKSRTAIDFRKRLDNSGLLTDGCNRHLLGSIKRFLCLQTHPALTGRVVLAPVTARLRVAVALHLIDYFMLRSDQFDLASSGFSQVTSNDVMALLDAITSNASVKAGIYEPEQRMLAYLAKVDVPADALKQLRSKHPDLFKLECGMPLALSREQTLVARAWLKLVDCYARCNHGSVVEYRYSVTRERLLSIIFGDRVLSSLAFDRLVLPGLDVAPSRCFARELPAVPVSNQDDDERAGHDLVGQYVSALRSMNVARAHGITLLPEQALATLDETVLLVKERTKARARFTTLPFSVANALLSKSISFFLEYGDSLVDYYLELASYGRDVRRLSCPVPAKLAALGVVRWRSTASGPYEFFSELRSGACLHNMLEVLLGAIAILVNTLMARRASELTDLRADSIVEEHGLYFLAFNLRKANVLEHRQRALRPMPTIAAEALLLLAKLSNGLQSLGYPNEGRLFEVPFSAWSRAKPFFGTCQPDLRRCFDRFCDFYQVDQDEQGRRYYVRAHQLRRNFAMLFFWYGSFGGVEVLRYFLGHSKPSMTYQYVTEAVSGKVLRQVKATVAKDLIKAEHSATEALAQLICDRYGLTLNELHILPEQDVVDYVEQLLASDSAEVEPEFINGPHGEEYSVVYKVAPRVRGGLR